MAALHSAGCGPRGRALARAACLLGALAATAAIVATAARPEGASAAGSSVSGRVFLDYNSNGLRNPGDNLAQATDISVPGVEVKAYDSAGNLVGTATSAADGTYSLSVTGAASEQLRIEFSTPSGLEPSFVATGETSENNSSVQFVDAGATGVDYAVTNPDDYCQSDPEVITCFSPNGAAYTDTPGNPGGIRFRASMKPIKTNQGAYSYPGWPAQDPNPGPTYLYTPPDVVAASGRLGSVFGIGIDRDNNVFFGTYVKRHVPYGPAGATNTIYRRNLATGTASDVEPFITLPGTLPAHSAQNPVGVVAPDYGTDGRRNLSPGQQGYSDVWNKVGRVGLGDVDVSPDGKTLYAVDMDESAPLLYRVPLSGEGAGVTAGQPTSLPIPRPTPYDGSTCEGTWHPMGMGLREGRLLVGGVCGAENTVGGTLAGMPVACQPFTLDLPNCNPTVSPYGKLVNGRTVARGYVLEYSGGSWSTVASIPFDQKRSVFNSTGAPHQSPMFFRSGIWRAWTDERMEGEPWNADGLSNSSPQPMISNIEITDSGSLIVGIRDRWTDKRGNSDTISYESPAGDLAGQPFSGGDLVRLCPSTGGRFDVESGGSCGSELGGDNPQVAAAGIGYGGSSFYFNAFGYQSGSPGRIEHGTTGLGSTATMPGSTAVWTTAYDVSAFYQQGVRALGYCAPGSTDCGPDNGGIGSQLAGIEWAETYGWQKGNGLADLEMLCNRAPVQVGNRIWIDANRNGIQDPGEKTVAGATVRLYNAGGTLVGTAITDAQGRYYFSSTVDKPAAGDGTSQGGGLRPGAKFSVRLDNPADYRSGGPLNGYVLTTKDAGTDVAINSKAFASGSGAFGSGSFPEISIASREPGQNNHTFDAGFVLGSGATGPRLSVAVGGCIHAKSSRTVRLSLRNPNTAAMSSRRVEFTVPKGFKVVGASRGHSISRGRVIWKGGTVAAGKTQRLYVKLKATGRPGTRSRLLVSASGTVNGTAVKAARRTWSQVCARPRFTG